MASLTVDFIISLDGYGAAEGWPGYWGMEGGESWLETHGAISAALVICAVSVLMSMSRNGAISMFVAAAIVGAALYRRGTLDKARRIAYDGTCSI